MLEAVLLQENGSEEPTEQEVMLYAESIGIDVEKERDLLYIAKEGISANLPKGWQVLKDENNQIFYYDSKSGISLWEHPLDKYFRDCVIKARQRNQHIVDKVNSAKDFDNESSENCLISSTVLLSDLRKNVINKQMPENFARSRTSSYKNSSYLFNGYKQSETKTNENISKILSTNEKNNHQLSTDKPDTEHQNTIVESNNEPLVIDDPTEYHELKPSSGRSLKLFNSDIKKLQITSQADHLSSSKNFKAWSKIYTENLRKADKNLTVLQSKVRKSLLTNKRKTSEVFSDAISYSSTKYNHLTQQPSTEIYKCLSSSNLLDTTDDKEYTFCKMHEILTSPTKKFDDKFEDIPCPQVGLSPSEIKNHLTIDFSNRKPNTLNTSSDNNKLETTVPWTTQHSIPNGNNGKVTDGNQVNQRNIKSKRNVIGLSECISHLIEERSRIQSKLFRLKLLYKTYKRRLDNLDTSLSALQQQTNLDLCSDILSACKTRDSTEYIEKGSKSILPTSPTNGNLPLSTPQDSKVTTSIINSEGDYEGGRMTSSLSYCYPNISRVKRSLSVPRSPFPRYQLRSPGINLFHDNITTSQDLATSLASIDVQLHHVLKHLDSSTNNHQSPLNHSDIKCQCSVSMGNNTEHHCVDVDANLRHIQRCLANVSLNDTPQSGHISNNLTYSPSCSCWKTSCKSHSKTLEAYRSPTDHLLNSYSDFTSNERDSIRASAGSFLTSMHKSEMLNSPHPPCNNNNNNNNNNAELTCCINNRSILK
ncbi:unnamed protein product [Heterobilharzia americana]|nr:unnamed protein product [Heterobilharzia americana]